ncbi:Brefeldin A resistance protein [Diplodia seriata]|uniref:Brefeldin A resistance protein n=1 Tax=Diplodia seriata TaxID=420778 RepID=A0A1S8BHG6_9PEZI|nr:Brefeldin A resistance protein [Diplodia seriata]
MPTVPNAIGGYLQALNPAKWLSRAPAPTRKLLHKFGGTVRGGEMLLVLGKPGSGCTTFLKTLANMRQEYYAVDGEVLVGGDDAVKMKKNFPGEFAFSSEDDVHFPTLSVDTTLRFSVNARTSQTTQNRGQAVEGTLHSLLDLFGLSHVRNTRVGDDYKRGVSGGQRHRVTVAEAISTRSGVLCLDNPTRGLDSSTALKLVHTLRSYTTRRRAATMASVYQASDAMAQLFDKVLVINAGRQAYFGPLGEARRYFEEELGFHCDARMSLTDYLTTMSGDRRSRAVRHDHTGPPPPATPEEFEAAFRRSRHWAALMDETAAAPDAPQRSGSVGYALPFWRQAYECMLRQHRVQLTDRGPWVAEAAGLVAQALMLGTLYWDQQPATRGLYTRAAALFFNVLVMVLQASAEFGNTFAQRPILLRHEAMMLYRPAAYALGQILADMPWKAAIVLYNLPIYLLAGFQRDAGSFFAWFFVLYCAVMALGVMFRTIAVFTISPTRAILPVGMLMNVLIIYTGFYITPPGMKAWLGWIRIGMEQFKMPAGKLATVFFSGKVEQFGDAETESPKESWPSEIVKTERVFAWKDLSIDVKTADGVKRLLDNVSGYLAPGSMTALMGMSGAGKVRILLFCAHHAADTEQTTLLNAISQRASIGVLTGSMFVDGAPVPRSFKRRTGFVHQQDVHLSSSTVREALRLVAYLRQPASVPHAAKDAYVEAVLQLLEMADVADALIGEPGAGLSLERRKRVSIGVELAARPDMLVFLDEPTSGLDGDSALSAVRLLRKLADAGLTVLCTIHQPAARLMRAFDDLLLLVPGGQTAYAGPLGEDCAEVLEYFARHTRRCRPWENPADYFLAESVNPDVDWFGVWRASPKHEKLQQQLADSGSSSADADDDEPERYAASWWEQLRVVTRRAYTDYWRDPDYVLGKVQMNVWMGLVNSLTYLQLGDSLTDTRSKMFSIFVGVITGPVIALAVEPRFTRLRDHFLARDRDSNTYHWLVFVASTMAVELPWALAAGAVYWLLWHFAVGFPRPGYAFAMYELYTLFVTAIAQMTAASFPTLQGAHMATGFVFLIVNTFNGPLSPPPLTPRGWRWIYDVSPLFYFVEAMAANAVHAQHVACTPAERTTFFTPPDHGTTCRQYAADYFAADNSTGYLLNPSATGLCEYCPFLDGDQYVCAAFFPVSLLTTPLF